jgi:diadenylate cyclase
MEQLEDLFVYLRAVGPLDVVDIGLVALLFYSVLFLVRGTRAVQLLRGILVVILLVFLFNEVASLLAFQWLLEKILPALFVAVPVIFQPELRRALEQIGRARFFPNRVAADRANSVVTVVSLAARRLSEQRHGALIVLERETGLNDLVDRGVRLDAEASVELLTQIFYKNSPLHDGAVMIRDGRIAAAGVVLPLSDMRAAGTTERGLGTRHLAALNISETTDALAVVVSEETGTISVARNGKLVRHLDEGELARLLYRWFVTPITPAERFLGPLIRATETESPREPERTDSQPAEASMREPGS